MVAEAAGNCALLPILTRHADSVIQYITTKYTEAASQKTMLVSIMAVYKLMNLKAKSQASYDSYLELFDKLDSILKERSKSNLPSQRQAAGFVSHAELHQLRRKLPIGSKERLLLSFYGGCIPPVRNDLHSAFVHMLEWKEGAAEDATMSSVTPNCILLPYDMKKEGAMILWELRHRTGTILFCTSEDWD